MIQSKSISNEQLCVPTVSNLLNHRSHPVVLHCFQLKVKRPFFSVSILSRTIWATKKTQNMAPEKSYWLSYNIHSFPPTLGTWKNGISFSSQRENGQSEVMLFEGWSETLIIDWIIKCGQRERDMPKGLLLILKSRLKGNFSFSAWFLGRFRMPFRGSKNSGGPGVPHRRLFSRSTIGRKFAIFISKFVNSFLSWRSVDWNTY